MKTITRIFIHYAVNKILSNTYFFNFLNSIVSRTIINKFWWKGRKVTNSHFVNYTRINVGQICSHGSYTIQPWSLPRVPNFSEKLNPSIFEAYTFPYTYQFKMTYKSNQSKKIYHDHLFGFLGKLNLWDLSPFAKSCPRVLPFK